MKKTVLSFLAICIAITTMQAQNEPVNPFEEFGYKPKIATLSKGKYVEFHDQDTIVQIGGAIFNTVTMKIMGFVEYDTIRNEYNINPEVISRWLSPDPLTSEFPSWSPYNYAADNPIFYTDPDGQAVVPVNEDARALLFSTAGSFGVSAEKFSTVLGINFDSKVINSTKTLDHSGQLDFKGFKKELKRGGIKLNKTQLAEAYDFFNVIQSDKVVELGVFIEPTGGNTTRPGDSGTEIVEGDSPSKNENFRQFSLEFKDNPKILGEKTGDKGFTILPFEKQTPEGDPGNVGTIIIDATGNTQTQSTGVLKESFKEIEP